jgi:hypothetical protein
LTGFGQIPVATDVVPNLAVDRIQEQRIDREITAQRILLHCAEDVVAQDAAAGVLAFIVFAVEQPTECRNLDQRAALTHVSQPKAAADQATAWKNLLDFLGGRAGGNVEILGRFTQQQVAHAATDNKCLETRFLQAANDVGRMRTKLLEPDPMLRLRNGNEVSDDDLRFVAG